MKTLRRSGLLIVIVVAALMAAPLLGFGSAAYAQCVQSGSNVDCATDDPDGFNSTADNLIVTIDAGVTVNNTSGSAGIGVDNNSTVTNNGTIDTTDGTGIQVNSGSTVANNGDITTSGTSVYGVFLKNGGSSLTNDGTITVTGASTRGVILGGTAGNTVTNNGTIESPERSDPRDHRQFRRRHHRQHRHGHQQQHDRDQYERWQRQRDHQRHSYGCRHGDRHGAGNDSVTLAGDAPEVNGTIDGGADNDTLTFAFDVAAADYAALSSQIALANAASGSLSYNGQTYFWANFETLVNMLNQIAAGGGSAAPAVRPGAARSS